MSWNRSRNSSPSIFGDCRKIAKPVNKNSVRISRNNLARIIPALFLAPALFGADFDEAAKSTNGLGVDLYRAVGAHEGNLCLSPYSISCALSMTLAGADGETRAEMARVLHIERESEIDSSFAALQKSLEEM